ncbi:hypothetical protein [Bhargavaea ullalensis]|uniref:LPXTG-motif cell wall anchor domain-containing protein n=3 Tax=Bhargavaea ullalensis TaxID=1265685 RepID=A0ABV2GDK4_9BACL
MEPTEPTEPPTPTSPIDDDTPPAPGTGSGTPPTKPGPEKVSVPTKVKGEVFTKPAKIVQAWSLTNAGSTGAGTQMLPETAVGGLDLGLIGLGTFLAGAYLFAIARRNRKQA